MKHKVVDLTGIVPDNGSIDIDGLDLLQKGQKIGSIQEETLTYLIENRNDLQILKFIEPQVTKEGVLVDVKLFSTLKSDLVNVKQFSYLRVIYYGVVMLASGILLLFSLFYETEWWMTLFILLTFLSGAFLLVDYLKQHGRIK